MTYSQKDVFPKANTPRQWDIASIVEALAPMQDVPVVYSFGGGAPTSITLTSGNGRTFAIIDSVFAGSIGTGKPGVTNWPGRMFVEFDPYAWNPLEGT